MIDAVHTPRRRDRGSRAIGGAALALTLVLTACSGGGGGAPDEVGNDRTGPNEGPLPTLAGGVELAAVDPLGLLVGADLSFGAPLPSEQAAAQAFVHDPEVAGANVRRVFGLPDARRLGDVLVLSLDGTEIFDEGVLRAFEEALVASLAGGPVQPLELAGRATIGATGPAGGVVAFREGNALVVVTAPVDADAVLITTRMIEARARGEVGAPEPRTPLVQVPPEAVFLPVPTVSFTPFSPPEDEPPPPAPMLVGATAIQGRYGVVGGERRTTVWSLAVDPATYPTAESLEPAMMALASGLAGGAPASPVELIDRVVVTALADVGQRSAHVFRHQGLVVVVESNDPAQLDAVTTAWITALGPT